MPDYSILWDDEFIEHIAHHGVTLDEFTQVVNNPTKVQSNKVAGRTEAFGWVGNRFLVCIYEVIGEDEIVPYTAYEV
jgi:uncharacterized DUF497 family protein